MLEKSHENLHLLLLIQLTEYGFEEQDMERNVHENQQQQQEKE